jgi:hypothetical protein
MLLSEKLVGQKVTHDLDDLFFNNSLPRTLAIAALNVLSIS